MRKRMRTITVAGVPYRWYRYHDHEPGEDRRICREIIVVFDPANKRAPLRLRFREGPQWAIDSGYLSTRQNGVYRSFSLNHPRVIAALITTARGSGWEARRLSAPLVVDDPFGWLLELEDPGAAGEIERTPDC
ncbi:MAG TPA: hypothetical protein VD886_09910 [Herpetosiphonaceae bacterium]|nr:hypothetical protein [Herpetosiphonaceae bacterium]